MTQGFDTSNRPGQEQYQQAYDNKGKYGASNKRPYINPNVPMYVPQDGQNCIRVVDPIELATMGTYFFDVFFHRDVGYKKDYFLCDKEHGRGPCPSCELVTGDLWENDKDLAKALSPDMRRLLWVLDLQKPQEVNVLKLWSCPRTLSDEILTQSRRPDQNVFVDIAHPETGVPIFFTRSGQGRQTKYTGVQLGQQPYPIGEDIAYQRFEFNDILMWHEYNEFDEILKTGGNVAALLGTVAGDPSAPAGPSAPAYDNAPSAPAEEIGAAAAAAANPSPAGPGSPESAPGEIDYSDYDRIQPDNKECFRKNYDQYNECDTCADKELCGKPWPVIQATGKTAKPGSPAGPSKTAKPSSPSAPAGPSGPGAPASPGPAAPESPSGPAGGGNKILDAQAKLRAEINARKAGN